MNLGFRRPISKTPRISPSSLGATFGKTSSQDRTRSPIVRTGEAVTGSGRGVKLPEERLELIRSIMTATDITGSLRFAAEDLGRDAAGQVDIALENQVDQVSL